jgi:hypothetical protein
VPSVAEEFFQRLRGYDRAHGNYLLGSEAPEPGQKASGRGVTRAVGPSVELWEKHLAGTYRLGVVPIMADGTAVWGAIDVDVYEGLSHTALHETVDRLELPLVVVRSKSGGAHLYLFCSEPVPAAQLRLKLRRWATALGFADSEIFPKQDRIDVEGSGNWLNMPYFGGAYSTSYALDAGGLTLSPTDFIKRANELAVDADRLERVEPNETVALTIAPSLTDLSEAPPCLETLLKRGVDATEGRNETLFNVVVYLKKCAPDELDRRLETYNSGSMRPPLGARELNTIKRSALKKNYNYACSKQPLAANCDRMTCVSRRFGVAAAPQREDHRPTARFGQLTKLQLVPPVWLWLIDGFRVMCTTEELFNQRRLALRYTEAANGLLRPVPPTVYVQNVAQALATALITPIVPDATEEGQMISLLKRYCSGRSLGKTMDELALGKPFILDGRVYFRVTDFLTYLSQHKMKNVDASRLYTWFYEKGLEHHVIPIKGGIVDVWSIAKFEGTQTESFDVPRSPDRGDPF